VVSRTGAASAALGDGLQPGAGKDGEPVMRHAVLALRMLRSTAEQDEHERDAVPHRAFAAFAMLPDDAEAQQLS
jgi:hypothetical protein